MATSSRIKRQRIRALGLMSPGHPVWVLRPGLKKSTSQRQRFHRQLLLLTHNWRDKKYTDWPSEVTEIAKELFHQVSSALIMTLRSSIHTACEGKLEYFIDGSQLLNLRIQTPQESLMDPLIIFSTTKPAIGGKVIIDSPRDDPNNSQELQMERASVHVNRLRPRMRCET